MNYLILCLVNLGNINGFNFKKIVAQNSITKINVIPFTMPYMSQHICNEFPTPNIARVIATLAFTRMFSLMFVLFHSRLGLEMLI
jgi:ABC-type uncharacterized transport system permease subunit